jgi:hypothetical protein
MRLRLEYAITAKTLKICICICAYAFSKNPGPNDEQQNTEPLKYLALKLKICIPCWSGVSTIIPVDSKGF